jgi:hypothetical protein
MKRHRDKKYDLYTIHIYTVQFHSIKALKKRRGDKISVFLKLNLETSGGRAFRDDMALYTIERGIKSVFGFGTMKKPVVACLVGAHIFKLHGGSKKVFLGSFINVLRM